MLKKSLFLMMSVMFVLGVACSDSGFNSGTVKSVDNTPKPVPDPIVNPTGGDVFGDPLGPAEGEDAPIYVTSTPPVKLDIPPLVVNTTSPVKVPVDAGAIMTELNNNPAAQEGLKVEACFSYDRVKIPGHNCNSAKFDIYFQDVYKGAINLDNASGANNPNKVSSESTGYSVFGGVFEGSWKDGSFKVQNKCQNTFSCHTDVTFLSLIGEVRLANGKTMWLQIEQGKIKPTQAYVYKFSEFKLTEIKPSFGPLCQWQ